MSRLADPFKEVDPMFGILGNSQLRGVGLMPMDAFESNGVYTLRFDLAGADPDKVDLTVEGGMLTVTAERPPENTAGVNWLVRERPTGTHSRQVRLGDTLDAGKVEATYDQGVLTITIPMRAEAKPQRISISTGDTGAIGG
jgi:HSP20 family protein